MDTKKLVEIVKRKLGFKFDRELADALNLTRSGLSQKISRGDVPISEIRQLLQSKGIDISWLKAYEERMQKNLYQEGPEARLRDKDQIIQIQQDYINDLKKTIERMEEEHKKKWIPEIAPNRINQPKNYINQGA